MEWRKQPLLCRIEKYLITAKRLSLADTDATYIGQSRAVATRMDAIFFTVFVFIIVIPFEFNLILGTMQNLISHFLLKNTGCLRI